jgi:diaminopimelate decarboxylase
VAEAGYLLARVTDVKPSIRSREQPTPTFVATDTSLNHLLPAALYDAYHEILIADRALDTESPQCPVHICGNLMQAGDVLAKDRLMPELREGDLLVFKTVGAYTSCRGSRFNERPLPAEVLVNDGHASPSRRREGLEDLVRGYICEESE